jgi:diguanylate cyclase (GGDEF)-like protein
MEQAMKMNRIYKNRKAIILFADMDGLKQINDNYGHAAGDIAICACADILKKAAGVNGIAGRLGGDEFALMMIGDETRAIELMETVQKEIAMYNAQGKNKFAIDMSVGCQIVLCTEELSIPMVLEKADKIMYEEKKKKGKAR